MRSEQKNPDFGRELTTIEGLSCGWHWLIVIALASLFGPMRAGAQAQIPVHIESTPPGASVFLDRDTPDALLGQTPLVNIRVPAGNHTLIFRSPNHDEERLAIFVRRRRETFRAVLDAHARLELIAQNDSANGANIRIDGQPVGLLPYETNLRPGRHLIQVERDGFVTFHRWVDLEGGHRMTLPILLEAEQERTGSVLVAGDVSGAAVYIDGTPRGSTPTVIDGLSEGSHRVEVRADDPSIAPFVQEITIVSGERVALNPQLRPTHEETGTVRVLSNVPGARVRVDGNEVGIAPVSVDELTPGEHIVEVSAPGYRSNSQPVTVSVERQSVISVELEPGAAHGGQVIVRVNIDGAEVFVDGESHGAPPVIVESTRPGMHSITVRAEGYREFRHTCPVSVDESCEVNAELRPIGVPVRVIADVPRAEFYVDGEARGPVPWEGSLPMGGHEIEVRSEGHESYVARVELRPSDEPRVIEAMLDEGNFDILSEEPVEAAFSHVATPLSRDLVAVDASVGWPFLLELRLGIGVLDFLDAGVAIRTTFYRLTEFEGRVRVGFRPVRALSLGVVARIGGGLGGTEEETEQELEDEGRAGMQAEPLPVNSFFFSIEARSTLHFLSTAAFTLFGAFDYHSDRYAFNGESNECRYLRGCREESNRIIDRPIDILLDGERLADERRSYARLRVGGTIELSVSSAFNIFATFEGILAGLVGDVIGETLSRRPILGDIFGLRVEDTELYGRLGFTYKFGS